VNPALFPALCVVLASDGIWDNWEYADVSSFVMDPKNSSSSSPAGKAQGGVELAGAASQALIKSNAAHAHRNFGAQADNATGVVLFIHPAELPL
jgi:serine/threonine protein phosphatase PrpC